MAGGPFTGISGQFGPAQTTRAQASPQAQARELFSSTQEAISATTPEGLETIYGKEPPIKTSSEAPATKRRDEQLRELRHPQSFEFRSSKHYLNLTGPYKDCKNHQEAYELFQKLEEEADKRRREEAAVRPPGLIKRTFRATGRAITSPFRLAAYVTGWHHAGDENIQTEAQARQKTDPSRKRKMPSVGHPTGEEPIQKPPRMKK